MASDSLKKLMADVHGCQIVLPEFQRDFVWRPAAVIKLLTSIFSGYPIGSLLFMENNGNYGYNRIEGVSAAPTPLADKDTILGRRLIMTQPEPG